MQYTHLGRAGARVSRFALGTMNFGNVTDEPGSFEIMNRALDEGLNFWDTANAYGGKGNRGGTETILGKWFAEDPSRRDRVVLATKLYANMTPEKWVDWPNYDKLSAVNIRRACEASLRRLQTDHIDLYQFHHIDRDTPWEEIWQACEQLVREGKIIYAGSSNFAGWHIVQANEAAAGRSYMGLVSEQCKYSLAERTVEMEVLPAAERYGVGIIPWSPLDGGFLAGVLAKEARQGRRGNEKMTQRVDAHREQLEAWEGLCEKLGAPPANVALAWLLHQPAVTAPIIGPRTLEQLTGALEALELELDDATLETLDEIFPGPGGPGPEAWAW